MRRFGWPLAVVRGEGASSSNMITSRELHVAIPVGTRPGQWDQIRRAIEYGKTKDITVKITETH